MELSLLHCFILCFSHDSSVILSPKTFLQVCGNDKPVMFLSEWLHTWRQGRQASKDSSAGDECDMQDTDYNSWQSDSDSEGINGSPSLKNVLLITGPVGVSTVVYFNVNLLQIFGSFQ